MKFRKSFSAALALLVASAFVVPGLGALDKTTVVLDWTVNTNHTGLYVAQAKGWFQDAGLDVEVQPAPESGAVGLVASGRADFAYSYQEELLQARSGGLALTAVAAVIQNNTSGFAMRKSANIHRPKDFEGKRYGGWGSPMDEATIKTLMKADGGDPSKVTIVNFGEQDFFSGTEKNIDFAWVFEGWTVQEAAVRGIPLDYIDLRKFDPVFNEFTPVMVTSEALLKKNPAKAKAFLVALTKGYQYAIAHPDEAAAILLKAAPELNPALVKLSQKFLAGQYQAQAARWGEFDAGRWNGFQKWMVDNGILRPLTPGQLPFTNDYLPAAVKK
jgi:ABC-type nitrate/sulfonate/bicarbonate transport system substrate-binding protein